MAFIGNVNNVERCRDQECSDHATVNQTNTFDLVVKSPDKHNVIS